MCFILGYDEFISTSATSVYFKINDYGVCETKRQLVFKLMLWRVHLRIYESGSYVVALWYPNRSPRIPFRKNFFLPVL